MTVEQQHTPEPLIPSLKEAYLVAVTNDAAGIGVPTAELGVLMRERDALQARLDALLAAAKAHEIAMQIERNYAGALEEDMPRGIYTNYVVPDTGNAQKALRDAIQAAETEEEAR